jgi:hypothetical protein
MNNYKDKDEKNDEPELFSSIKNLPGGDNDKNNVVTATLSGCGASLLVCVVLVVLVTIIGAVSKIKINEKALASVMAVMMISAGIGVYKLVSKKHID